MCQFLAESDLETHRRHRIDDCNEGRNKRHPPSQVELVFGPTGVGHLQCSGSTCSQSVPLTSIESQIKAAGSIEGGKASRGSL
jgi:hypothetical protein